VLYSLWFYILICNRCLSETGGKHLIIPISVNYEAIPEQSSLAMEADGEFGNKMSIFQLFSWLKVSLHFNEEDKVEM
jgi:glycerol-3-phosphate O-acyltransferase